ncbi:MAG: type IV conjugative transfer system coupling protein TraD [Legionella sp.]|nr:MAG: type IV conjugative transfer system coupling protein TraD [Legionella sp.]
MKQGTQFIRGGQIFGYNTRMMAQVANRLIVWGITGYLLLVSAILFYTSKFQIIAIGLQAYAKALSVLGLGGQKIWQGSKGWFSADYYLRSPFLQKSVEHSKQLLMHDLVIALIVSAVIYMVALFFFVRFFMKKGEKYSVDRHISGTRLASPKALKKSVKKGERGISDVYLLTDFPIPRRSEFQGFFFHGSTGSGKTQAMMRLLDEIRRLGEPAIIYDKECTIKPYFFNKDLDIELNPVSATCANWDLWSECENPMEFGNLASYLIPKAVQGSDPFWVDSARTILTSMTWKIRNRDDRSAILLLQLLLTTTLEDLRDILKGTESENLVSREIEKTAISIKSVLATYMKSLRFLEGLDKNGKDKFSIKGWIKEAAESNAPEKSWLFITSRSKYHKEIKPLISLWLGLAMQGIQSLKPNTNKRIWLVMDELASLQRLEGLSDTVADIRKFGGCVAVGVQSITQLEFLYGHHESHAITDLLNTSLYFRSPKSRVAKWVSDDLGEQLVDEVRESQSYGPDSIRDGNTISTQRVTRKTVDAGQVMTMEDLHCYVRVIGDHPIAKIKTEYVEREAVIEPLVERVIDFDALEKINQQAIIAQYNPNVDGSVKKIQALDDLAHDVGESEDSLEKSGASDLLKIERVEMAYRHEPVII